MGSVNWKNVLIAGLAAGVALNAVDIVANGFLFADAWAATMEGLGIDYENASAMSAVLWIVIDFIVGIVIAWIYASISTRYGASTRTGLMAGGAVWVAMSLVFLGEYGMGIIPMNMMLMVWASGFVAAMAGGYVAARLYKEA